MHSLAARKPVCRLVADNFANTLTRCTSPKSVDVGVMGRQGPSKSSWSRPLLSTEGRRISTSSRTNRRNEKK